jgi:hypothetical protein
MTQARFILALSKDDGSRIGLQSESLAFNESGEEVFLFAQATKGEAEANQTDQKRAREFIQILGRRYGTFTDNIADPS